MLCKAESNYTDADALQTSLDERFNAVYGMALGYFERDCRPDDGESITRVGQVDARDSTLSHKIGKTWNRDDLH